MRTCHGTARMNGPENANVQDIPSENRSVSMAGRSTPAGDALDGGLAEAFGPTSMRGETVLGKLCETIGSTPRVLLRDTDPASARNRLSSPAPPRCRSAGSLVAAATPGRDRSRRHGSGAQGPRHRSRSRPRRQGVARPPSRPAGNGAPVRRGGPDRRAIAASRRRTGV